MDNEFRSELRRSSNQAKDLAASLELDERDASQSPFPVRVPPEYLSLIEGQDPKDPLLRQVWPDSQEDHPEPGYVEDPVGDHNAEVLPGLLSKYAHRVLIIATGACPIHCRYCFRRHFPYPGHRASRDDWRRALDYIREHEDISEVILSGGDPLMLATRHLATLTGPLGEVSHIRRFRIHTRMPVVVPSRVNDELVNWLNAMCWRPSIVLHVNHPRELSPRAIAAIARLRCAGATMMNQSVLLHGVNDEVTTLAALSESLFDAGVMPYYLHQLDPVAGAAHFQVSDDRAREIHNALRARLPGYLVPKLVRERAGGIAKEPL